MQPKSAVLIVSTSVIHVKNTWITTHVPTAEGWKAELANLQWTVYPQSGTCQP